MQACDMTNKMFSRSKKLQCEQRKPATINFLFPPPHPHRHHLIIIVHQPPSPSSSPLSQNPFQIKTPIHIVFCSLPKSRLLTWQRACAISWSCLHSSSRFHIFIFQKTKLDWSDETFQLTMTLNRIEKNECVLSAGLVCRALAVGSFVLSQLPRRQPQFSTRQPEDGSPGGENGVEVSCEWRQWWWWWAGAPRQCGHQVCGHLPSVPLWPWSSRARERVGGVRQQRHAREGWGQPGGRACQAHCGGQGCHRRDQCGWVPARGHRHQHPQPVQGSRSLQVGPTIRAAPPLVSPLDQAPTA